MPGKSRFVTGAVTGAVTDRYGLCDGFNFLKYLINKDCDGVTAQNTGSRRDRQEEEFLGIRAETFNRRKTERTERGQLRRETNELLFLILLT
jgi:hypothetical protein